MDEDPYAIVRTSDQNELDLLRYRAPIGAADAFTYHAAVCVEAASSSNNCLFDAGLFWPHHLAFKFICIRMPLAISMSPGFMPAGHEPTHLASFVMMLSPFMNLDGGSR